MNKRVLWCCFSCAGVLVLLLGTGSIGATAAVKQPLHTDRSLAAERPTIAPQPTEGAARPTLCSSRRQVAVDVRCPERTANVCVGAWAETSGGTNSASLSTYTLIARNTGQGSASRVSMTLPLRVGKQTVIDATFSRGDGWVTAVVTNAVHVQFDSLRGGEAVTASLLLGGEEQTSAGDLRAEVQWNDQQRGGTGYSNSFRPTIDGRRSEQAFALAITPPAGDNSGFLATSNDFATNEPVSVWYYPIGGTAVSLPAASANAEGAFAYAFMPDMPPNTYVLVAYGQCSATTAVGQFAVVGKERR